MAFSLNRPYVRIRHEDTPPVFIQDGIPYAENGTLIDPIPEWYQSSLDRLTPQARLDAGFNVPGPPEGTEVYHPYDRKMERRPIPPAPPASDAPDVAAAGAGAATAGKEFPKPAGQPAPGPVPLGGAVNDQPGRVTEPGQSGVGEGSRGAPTVTDSTVQGPQFTTTAPTAPQGAGEGPTEDQKDQPEARNSKKKSAKTTEPYGQPEPPADEF